MGKVKRGLNWLFTFDFLLFTDELGQLKLVKNFIYDYKKPML